MDKQQQFTRDVSNFEGSEEQKKEALVYATIKLPEILSGWEEQDFRKERKQKQYDMKQKLDEFVEQQKKHNDEENKVIMGMSEEEILMNQEEFKMLGLL